MGRPKKVQVNDDLGQAPAPSVMSNEDLREILRPFVIWAWADPEKAEAVIDKYFKQNGISN